ncbi:serine/threonine-protein kinase [Fibrella sp. WM1]|uniref:serine/threonine-protein kinase n=1 Tax=Fibrella musci TaxID=3242485 RepID=UPI0035201EEE
MSTVNFNVNFPDYEIISELGRGNARVLKARHRPTGDLVAIKQFALNTDPDTLRRFARESDIMTGIEHPNIVRVREIQLEAAMPYLVMEFVEGGDLRGLLRTEGRLTLTTLIRLGLQMAEAFKVIHSRGVVHRDIKPENILYRRLVSGELHFLLTDFGIAKIRADESTRTRTGQSLMTYEYAAPEQFDDPRQVNVATDFYGLGVVLYEALTGQVPFALHNDAGLAQFMNQVLTAPPPPPYLPDGQYVPPSLTEALRQMLAKNSAQRLDQADELELLLEQAKVELLRANNAQFSRPAGATPVTASGTSPGWAVATPSPAPPIYDEATAPVYEEDEPTDRTTWWFLGGVGVVAVGVLTFVLINQNRPSDPFPTKGDSTAVTTPIDSSMLFRPTETTSDTTAAEPESTEPEAMTPVEEETVASPPQQTPTVTPELDSAATMGTDSTE